MNSTSSTRLAPGAGTVLPLVSQLLSHHHIVPPGSGSAGNLGRLHPVTVPADWMNRVEMNETQYNEMFAWSWLLLREPTLA